MKSQQAAEREEQQRIKSLVLKYDLREGEEQDGDTQLEPLHLNTNVHNSTIGIDKVATANARPDKSSNNRSGQRARKLQLSDVDWYGTKKNPSFAVRDITQTKSEHQPPPYPALVPGTTLNAANLSSAGLARAANRPTPTSRTSSAAVSSGGRLTKKAMLAEHASRIAASGKDEK